MQRSDFLWLARAKIFTKEKTEDMRVDILRTTICRVKALSDMSTERPTKKQRKNF